MKPKDFYFQLTTNPQEDPSSVFIITPKIYYDQEGYISDESGVADEVLPESFGELMESMYEYNGDPQIGRKILLELGMTEIDFGLTQGEAMNPIEEEDFGQAAEYDDENDLDELLKKETIHGFDYENLSTDMLLRHKQMMVKTEDYLEAAKIQKELDSRQKPVE